VGFHYHRPPVVIVLDANDNISATTPGAARVLKTLRTSFDEHELPAHVRAAATKARWCRTSTTGRHECSTATATGSACTSRRSKRRRIRRRPRRTDPPQRSGPAPARLLWRHQREYEIVLLLTRGLFDKRQPNWRFPPRRARPGQDDLREVQREQSRRTGRHAVHQPRHQLAPRPRHRALAASTSPGHKRAV
jgi:hypothetical protein